MEHDAHRVRRVTSLGTPSYQYGHYEMQGEKGKRRSVFRVDVHLGEHATADEALASWPSEIARLESIGRANKADKLAAKLGRLNGERAALEGATPFGLTRTYIARRIPDS